MLIENSAEIKITSFLGELLYGQPKHSTATPRAVSHDDKPSRSPLYGNLQAKIKKLLENENLTIEEISSRLGIRDKQTGNALRHLRDKKLINCTGKGVRGNSKLWYLVK